MIIHPITLKPMTLMFKLPENGIISYPVCAFYILFTECRHQYLCSPFYQMDTTGQDENNILTARGCHSSPESQGHLHIVGFYKVASY